MSKAAFESYEYNVQLIGEEEKEIVSDLYEANCKVNQISRALQTKFDKNLSSQKIQNLICKLIPEAKDDALNLSNFLERMEDNGGTVATTFDAGGKVAALFLSSQSMKKAFLSSNATTIQAGTSFDFDASL